MTVTGLSSLARYSDRRLTFTLHDDGSLQPADVKRLETALSARVISREEADDVVSPILGDRPAAARYRRRSVLALKLLDIPLLTSRDLAYADTDILAFRPFAGLFEWPSESTAMLFMGDAQNAYALRPWHLVGRDAIRLPIRVNTGVLMMRAGAHDLDFVEWMLARDYHVYQRIPGWVEQTCWAALGQRAGCRLYDDVQVRVIRDAGCVDDAALVIGHFTSSVRSLWPTVPRQHSEAVPAERIRTRTSQPLEPTQLASEQVRRLARRSRLWIREHA